MKKNYLIILMLFLFAESIYSQTTETFETEAEFATSFTDNSQVFNITSQAGGPFDIIGTANGASFGWTGASPDNNFIDNSGTAAFGTPAGFTISSAGNSPFKLKSFYLFLARENATLASGNCTITGKRNGTTVFTATANSGFADPENLTINNGYTFINMTSYGGSNNSNVVIDQFVISTTGTFEYLALDAMTWDVAPSSVITTTGTLNAFASCSGNVSANQTISVSGTSLTANLVVTAPSGFEVSTTAGSGFGSSVSITPTSGTVAATNVYVRLTAAASGSPSGNITCTSTGVTTQNVAVTGTVTPSTNTSSTVSVCDTYTWPVNNQTYTNSGTYTAPALFTGIIDNLAAWTSNAANFNATVSSNNLSNQPNNGAINLILGTTNVSFTATNGFYNDATFISTNVANDPITISFNPPVYGVSANYFLTDTALALIPGNITVNYSNGSSASRNVTTTTDTFGYFSSNLISSVVISTTQTTPQSWISLKNLKIATNPSSCETKTLNLTITPSSDNTTTATACGTYTWANNNQTYTQSGIYTGTTTNCVTQKLNLTITPQVVPTFTQVAPICSRDTLAALSTTSTNLITGTWTPAILNTATTTYTFTPDNGQCATTATMTIVVNVKPLLTFTANPFPICAGTSSDLTVSVTPSLSFASQNLSLFAAAFGVPITAPLSGIIVNSLNNGCLVPTPGGVTPYTAGQFAGKIVLIERGGCTFAEKVLNAQNAGAIAVILYNSVAGSVTFSPGGVSAAVTIPVYGISRADGLAIIAAMVSGQLSINLNPPVTTLSYLWATGSVTTPTFNTGILNATTPFQVTVTNTATGCFTTVTVNATVTPNIVPTFAQIPAFCAGSTAPILPLTSTNTPPRAGTWSPAVIDNMMSGIYTFTPTPVGGQCLATTTMSITVTPNTDNVTTVSECSTYTWSNNNQTYTQSGIYTGTTTNCVTQKLNLTITPGSDNTTNVAACGTYTWANNNQTYTQSGIYTGTTTNCVTQKLNLTITPASDVTTIVGACDTYTWANNNQTYTQSGIYSGTTTNCVTQKLNLTITPASYVTTIVGACDTYTWANNNQTYTQSGIYSGTTTNCVTQKLNLTITPSSENVTTVSECSTYTWSNNNQTYTQSGIYTGTTTNCVTEKLNLTITPIVTISTQPQDQIVAENQTVIFTVAASGPSNYQWQVLFGNDWTNLQDTFVNPDVSGSTTNTLSISGNGLINISGFQFRVLIGTGNCITTSNVVNVTVTLDNISFEKQLDLKVYPNPFNDVLNISIGSKATIEIFDIVGKSIQSQAIENGLSQIDLNNLASGVYMMKVVNENNQAKTVRIVKK
jgi:PA domain/Secretion system C-terminal sorting domain